MRQAVVRDIREDLFERMEAATAEMASARTSYDQERRELEQRYQKIFDELATRQRSIAVLLDDEHRVHGRNERSVVFYGSELKLPFQEYILNLLSSSGGMNKDDIKDMAIRSGYGDEGESVGRMLHTTLMNLTKSGKLQVDSQGNYEAQHKMAHHTLSRSLLDAWAQTKEGPLSQEESGPSTDIFK